MHTQFLVGALVAALAGSSPATTAPVVATVPQASNTVVSVTLSDTVSSARFHPGDLVAAVANEDLVDAKGQVIVKAGATVQLKLVAFQRPMPRRDDARMLFQMIDALESFGTASVKANGVGLKTSDPNREFVVKGGTKVEFRY